MARSQSISCNLDLGRAHLFTDASVMNRAETVAAAWAGLLIAGGETFLRSGYLKTGMTDITEAELCSVELSMHSLLRENRIEDGTKVIVHCDNDSVVAYLNGKFAKEERLCQRLERIRIMAERHSLFISATWVKAHQGDASTCWRSLINARVDREARRLARQRQRELLSAPT